MWPNPQFPAHLITFTGDTLNVKLHFFVQCKPTTKFNQAQFFHPDFDLETSLWSAYRWCAFQSNRRWSFNVISNPLEYSNISKNKNENSVAKGLLRKKLGILKRVLTVLWFQLKQIADVIK